MPLMKILYDRIGANKQFCPGVNRLLLVLTLLLFNLNAYAADIVLQAESGTLTGVSTATTITGYTGSGYVNGATFDAAGDKIVVTTTISTAGSYQLKIRYYGAYGSKNQDIYINGAFIGNINFPASSGWVEKDLGLRSFVSGTNTIEIRHSWGWMHVDNVTILGIPSSSFPIPGTIQAESYSAMSGIQTETTT